MGSLSNQQFDDAFWAHQDPRVQELRHMADPEQRQSKANELAGLGLAVNEPIMVWGWDPALTMQYLLENGFKWVPCLGQPSIAASPSVQPQGPAPAGSFIVSTNIADYPPFNPPAPPAPPPHPTIASWVGNGPIPRLLTPAGKPWYPVSHPGCPLYNGETYVDPNGRGNFMFHVTGPFLQYFEPA